LSELAIGPGQLTRLGKKMRAIGLEGRAFVISDDRVFPLYGAAAVEGLRAGGFETASYQLPNGEPTKVLASASRLYDWLAENRAERNDAVVALGGGVVGDVAGFVAATFLRGMPLVQVPTTVLAQIDSSIGGKVAVNHPLGKNLIGAFYPARLIVGDTDTLRSLPPRLLADGWAEAIKCAMILDADLLDLLESNAAALCDLSRPDVDDHTVGGVVERCARHKVRVVTEDERETGLRMILNYGHTIGHALEAALDYETLLHGEAVSIGMAGAAAMSVALGYLDPTAARRQNDVLVRFGLPIRFPAGHPAPVVDRVLDHMTRDKKARASRLRWILLEGIGRTRIASDVPMELVRETVERLLSRET
jgi:3-dehydroquinate synthase